MSEEKPVHDLADLRRWAENPPQGALRPVLSVFGDPVAHSLSPQMMNPALAALGLEGRYIRLHIRAEEFGEAVRLLAPAGFAGTNVTIPHKFRALQSMDRVDPLAATLGAVNTVKVEGDRLSGSNSDGPGFLRALTEEFGVAAGDLRILVLGAGGGAGRAVAIQCALARCRRLVLINRTKEKAEAVAAELRGLVPGSAPEVAPWEEAALREVLAGCDLVVNGTSLGMRPEDPLLAPAGALQARHLVFDMIYRPLRTPLLQAAEEAGASTANGLSMLLHQGAISLETWFGRPAPVEVMRRALWAAAG